MFVFRIFFFAVLCLCAVEVDAAESARTLSSKLLDKELSAMIGAQSTHELEVVFETHEDIRSLRMECDVQLERERLPMSCFRVLEKEAEAGLIATKKKKEQEAWLDQLCVRRLKSVRDREEIRKLTRLASIPTNCRTRAEERAADLKYTQESERPSSLFKERVRDSDESARSLHDSHSL